MDINKLDFRGIAKAIIASSTQAVKDKLRYFKKIEKKPGSR